jgi:N-acetylmuramoyl-L-alanine amidase
MSNHTVKVVFTRTKDVYTKVNDRAAFLRKMNADVLVSLHTDSCLVPTAYGSTVLIDPRNQSPEAIKMGTHILEALQGCGMHSRGIRNQRLAVLTAAPLSILVEMGFANHIHDAALLNSATSREVLAVAIATGILEGLK